MTRRWSLKFPGRVAAARVEILLFVALWCACGAGVDSRDLEAFNLQQIGVEALAERGQFNLDGSAHPRLQARPRYEGDRPTSDSFLYNGRKYLSKQPGQVMLGALAYLPLRVLGLTYMNDYLLASALVTFLTASLMSALASVALFRMAKTLAGGTASLLWPLIAALSYGLASTAFPYAGVAHHDALATSFLVVAFYFVFTLAHSIAVDRRSQPRAALAGLALGLTLSTSMLPAPLVVVVAAYFISLKVWRLLPFFALGVLAGLLPMLVFNAVSFGNPLLLPNVAGNYRDTFFQLEWKNVSAKLGFYATSLTLYVPVFWAGLAGLAFLPREFRRERRVVLVLLTALALYVLNIGADGGCQYGPRYLLPAMPFACLGLAGFANVKTRVRRTLAAIVVIALGVFSWVVNLFGAMFGVMYCSMERYGLIVYAEEAARGEWHAYPLAPWLIALLIVSAALFVFLLLHARRADAPDYSSR